MKTLIKILLLLAVIILVAGCLKSDLFDNLSGESLKSAQPVAVTVPFKVNLAVYDYTDPSDNSCGGYPRYHNKEIGSGVSTHLGNLKVIMTFCFNIETLEYYDTDIVFTAANGDELYAKIPEGLVVPNEGENAEEYPMWFNDPITFTGGTGRFKGASGTAMTNAYVHNLGYTVFLSQGTLVLIKGNR